MKLPPALVAAVIGCLALQDAHAADVKLSGSAFYRERIALPQDAALLVELVDPAEPKAALGAATVAPAGQVPIAFELVVDQSTVSDGASYAIRARIEVDGSTRLASAEPVPVDPAHAGAPLSVLLVQAAGDAAGASGASLAGTEWRVLELDGKRADANVTTTLVFGADGAVSGNGGCNNFRGEVDIEGATMTFGQLASTMMACEEAKSAQEALFHAVLSQTASYSVQDGELTLFDASSRAVARLGEP